MHTDAPSNFPHTVAVASRQHLPSLHPQDRRRQCANVLVGLRKRPVDRMASLMQENKLLTEKLETSAQNTAVLLGEVKQLKKRLDEENHRRNHWKFHYFMMQRIEEVSPQFHRHRKWARKALKAWVNEEPLPRAPPEVEEELAQWAPPFKVDLKSKPFVPVTVRKAATQTE